MAITRGDFDLVRNGNIKSGRGIVSGNEGIHALVHTINRIADDQVRALAASGHEKPIEVRGDPLTQILYQFTVRVPSTTRGLTISVYADVDEPGTGTKWQLVEIAPGSTPSSTSEIASQSITSSTTGMDIFQFGVDESSMTFDANNETYRDVRLQLRIRSVGGDMPEDKPTVDVFGFCITQDKGDDIVDWDGDLDQLSILDDEAILEDGPLDDILIDRLLKSIRAAMSHLGHGFCQVYPYGRGPYLNSTFWRGLGPFTFPVTRAHGEVLIIPDTSPGEWGTTGPSSSPSLGMFLTAFSQAEHGDAEDGTYSFLRDRGIKISTTDNDANGLPAGDELTYSPVIRCPVRAGQDNRIFLAYRGTFDEDDSYDSGVDLEDRIDFTRWVVYEEGIVEIDVNATASESEDDLYDPAGALYPGFHLHSRGFNVTEKAVDVIGTAPNDEVPERSERFDIALRNRKDNGQRIRVALTPIPLDIKDEEWEGTHWTLGIHGWRRLNSVWLNAEYLPNLGIGTEWAGRLPSASPLRRGVEALNEIIQQPSLLYGVGCANGFMQDPFVDSLRESSWIKIAGAGATEPGSSPTWTTVAAMPVPAVWGASDEINGFEITIDYRSIYITSEKDKYIPNDWYFAFRAFLTDDMNAPYSNIVDTETVQEVTSDQAWLHRREIVKEATPTLAEILAFGSSASEATADDGHFASSAIGASWADEILQNADPWLHESFTHEDVSGVSGKNPRFIVVQCALETAESVSVGLGVAYGYRTDAVAVISGISIKPTPFNLPL